jgi:Ser/Thr protein kinase RdoA (MazF antagonist)
MENKIELSIKLKPWNEASYLVQVRRLRNLARKALELYPLKIKKISFINHGENATFKIEDVQGQKYLLRIHRNDYHTDSAIREELKWLSQLARDKSLNIPRPMKSKRGHLLEEVSSREVGTRKCCLFFWIEGQFIQKRLKPQHMFELGHLIGKLHKKSPGTKHRRYWDADGLVGKNPKFGSIENMEGLNPTQQKFISNVRKIVLKQLKYFEKKYPLKMGVIHADLHFGNLLWVDNSIGAIDFDDSGFGFFAYDLVIPLLSAEYLFEKSKNRKNILDNLKESLIRGYKTQMNWDKEDEIILRYLTAARVILMLAWLNSRSDNPRLKKYLKKAVKRTMARFKADPLFNKRKLS